ncbi:MAG: hypothetical protein ACOZE5_08865 [Verrucomicrobiota bacterium]
MRNAPYRPTHLSVIALTLGLALLALPAVSAAGADTRPLADQATKALPVTTTIEKGQPGPEFGGPYVLVVKNTSGAVLRLKATIAQGVVSHNRPRTFDLPEHALEAGGTWKIADLAVEDKVTLNAEGHQKLEVKITPAK